MSVAVDIQVQSDRARAYLASVRNAFDSGQHHEVVEKVAAKSFSRMVRATPKGYTGMTRQEWELKRTSPGEWWINNDYKVMRFLEYGTKAHGPKTAKALYIPLNRRAAIGGWKRGMRFGVDYVLAKREKGIKPMGIVAAEQERAESELGTEMRRFLKQLLNERRS